MRSIVVLVAVVALVTAKTIPRKLIERPLSKYDDDERRYHPDLPRNVKFLPRNLDELNSDYWLTNAHRQVHENVVKAENTNKAKNVILFLGDGMSIPTIAAARAYMGGEEKQLNFETFPYVGMSKTYCVDFQVADSACTSTAYLSGVKANYGTIGVNAQVPREDCSAGLDVATHTVPITKWALDAGKAAGVVTTARATHASPAGVYANVAEREWENNQEVKNSSCDDEKVDDIAEQLVHGAIGEKLRVVLGCGRGEFRDKSHSDEEGQENRRTDGKDLVEEWLAKKGERGSYVWNLEQLKQANASKPEFLLGLFDSGHCLYDLEIKEMEKTATEPTLPDMVETAINLLSSEEKGYFLFVEGARIDMAHHHNLAKFALDETVAFDKAVEVALRMTNEEETLIVVTADHGHVMTYNGYPNRGNNILEFGGIGDDDKPYLTLSYANGMGYYDHVDQTVGGRVDMTGVDTSKTYFAFPATVPMESETHGGEDVAVYARGPWSHLFTGNYEQHAIPHIMAYAACIGDGLKAC